MSPRKPGSPGGTTDPARRVAELTEQIRHHDELYYQQDKTVISDAEYDALLAELVELEQAHPELVSGDSPTQRVSGAPVSSLESVAHRRPMLSLANTYNLEEVEDWYGSTQEFLGTEDPLQLSIEPKLDGVAIELVYEQGRFVRAITRGDGRVGDDVTHTARTMRRLPTTLLTDDPPTLLEVRGEVIMTHARFAGVNARRDEAGEERFINPRNLTSGTLKLLDPRVAATRPLTFVVYGLGEVDGLSAETHSASIARLGELGLPTAGKLAKTGTLKQVLAHYDRLLAQRDGLPFDVDGAVIKLDRFDLQQRLGERSRSPRWAIAYKFPARQATAIVREIQVLVGRTGALTPRAVIEPTFVGGVTIEHVTLHNRDEIERLGVKVGDRVMVERAGDVIPKIVAVTESHGGEPFVYPDRCPVCDTPVVDDPEEVVVRCPNKACPMVLQRRIEHFVARGAMDVDGMGEKLVVQLLESGLVKGLSDLYRLEVEQLAALERMGEQSSQNVVDGLERSKTRPFSRLLYGLGIRHVGAHVSEVIAAHWSSVDALRAATVEQLEEINEIGPVVAASLVDWLADEEEQAQLDAMLALGLAPAGPAPSTEGEGPLAGRTFLVTGSLSSLSRREANERIKSAGGKLLSGVSKKLDVLVAGEKPGSKLKKAEALGTVEVLDETAFLALIGE